MSTAYLNCDKRIFGGVGKFGFPKMMPPGVGLADIANCEVIGFNYALTATHPENKIIHFYLDDYQFDRIWNYPDRYIPVLRRFKAVLAPDFSLYTDFPVAAQIFNRYRTMWCATYWQERGITVIPTISWSDEESFDWCFDGVPKYSLVSISTVGGFGNHDTNSKKGWLEGYEKCIEILQPSEILLFGRKHYPEIRQHCPILVVKNDQLERKEKFGRR